MLHKRHHTAHEKAHNVIDVETASLTTKTSETMGVCGVLGFAWALVCSVAVCLNESTRTKLKFG